MPAEVADYIDAGELYRVGPVRAALGYLTPARRAHSLRVALLAAERAAEGGVSEYEAVLAAGLHDCAKNLPADSPLLTGFVPPEDVPAPVLHQYSGAYVAERVLGVTDADVLDANPLPHLRPPGDERAWQAHLFGGYAGSGARLSRGSASCAGCLPKIGTSVCITA